jgi:hypothetical protein
LILAVLVLVFTLAATFIYVLPLQISIAYGHRNGNDHLSMEVLPPARLFALKFEIPVVALRWEEILPELYLESELEQPISGKSLNQSQESTNPLELLGALNRKRFRQALRMIGEYQDVLHYLTRVLRIKHFRWVINFGTGDPATTGFLTGLLWSLESNVYVRARRMLHAAAKPELSVVPDFQAKLLHVDFNCIFAAHFGHIIIVGYKLLKAVKKGVSINGRSSDSGPDEDSDGEH